ncbi:MAG: primosomal protein N' [Sphingobium sp.]|jgi:primosomal protein N' (replication factor Y)|nr:primosomal protein N' [Sphingobium sp.]MCI1271186.1 primosomal protein N' [Sphingobium sp.]MCI1754776.1 primosomal protein N' [Sphingobium sp.]MCI2053050.1 primosomal protein N' [Sphingobium sp.]
MTRVRVLTLNAALGPLDYRVPDGLSVEPGSIVEVPLGPRRVIGVVWEEDRLPDTRTVPDAKLRALGAALPVPPLTAPLRRLIEWVADYYMAPLAAVLRMAMPAGVTAGERVSVEYRLSETAPARLTPQRTQALERIGALQGSVAELAEKAEVSVAVIRGLIKSGALAATEVTASEPYPAPNPSHDVPSLNEAQQAAADIFTQAIDAAQFQTFLLDGVTGSGKTEVYFEGIARALKDGGQILVLLPEIALTEPFLKRFEARFGVQPVAWHSGLRQSERRRAWNAVARGQAQVVVGARSALFLPFARLGLIVVDEAHETSFKQEDGVRYHARDVAVMRGKYEGCPVVLASATPALETRHQVNLGNYREIRLPARFGGAQMPEIIGIDLLTDSPERQRWIAPALVTAIDETLGRGEQVLLFLNRRGYAPLTLCRHCGYRFQCPNCTSWMVEHKTTHRLACHHCGHVMPTPRACPECKEPDSLVACGPGVERIADEAALLFPQARRAIVTSDTLWSPEKVAEFVASVDNGAVDIIIGTQLVTKGYHFPNLTLVGVIDADLGLEGGDLRAAERCFQQISQVAGRAGRGEKPGRVFIQTRMLNAGVIRALLSGDTERFYAAEAESRRHAEAPPYGRFAAVIVSSESPDQAAETARRLGKSAPQRDGLHIYGPAPAPLAQLRGHYRHRLLVHAARGVNVQGAIRHWLGSVQWPGSVRVSVDIDPYSFM